MSMTSPGHALKLQKALLVLTTAIAVISDAMLIPFYPKLFEDVFGMANSTHVGTYLSATCLTVMVFLPMWAWLEKRVGTFPILIVSQLGAGLLSLAIFRTTDLTSFWLLSLGMIVFKASYLLVYPYLLRLLPKAGHIKLIGLLTVIVHLGGIAGATVGGWVVDHFTPQHAYIGMAFGDFFQMSACVLLLILGAKPPTFSEDALSPSQLETPQQRRIRLLKLGGIMLALYLGAFTIRPFFVQYWQSISTSSSAFVGGWIFSIPAWMALLCLGYQHWSKEVEAPPVQRSIALCVLGLLAIAIPNEVTVVAGLALFGWSSFRTMVHMDTLIFHTSPPESYASDFSRMNVCQQLGALLGFYAAGQSVALGGLATPFLVAFAGYALTGIFYQRFFAAPKTEEAHGEVVHP